MSEPDSADRKTAWTQVHFEPETRPNKNAKFQGKVLLTDENGVEEYHHLEFKVDELQTFFKLAALPTEERHKLFDAIALCPYHNPWLLKKTPHGGNRAGLLSKHIWHTARWLAPALYPEAELNERERTFIYKQLLRQMKKKGVSRTDPWTAVSFLCELNWKNFMKNAPDDIRISDEDCQFHPSKDPIRFRQALGSGHEIIKDYLDAIRTGKKIMRRTISWRKGSPPLVTAEEMRKAGWAVKKSCERQDNQEIVTLNCRIKVPCKRVNGVLTPGWPIFILPKPWHEYVSALLNGNEATLIQPPDSPRLVDPMTGRLTIIPSEIRMRDFRD